MKRADIQKIKEIIKKYSFTDLYYWEDSSDPKYNILIYVRSDSIDSRPFPEELNTMTPTALEGVREAVNDPGSMYYKSKLRRVDLEKV